MKTCFSYQSPELEEKLQQIKAERGNASAWIERACLAYLEREEREADLVKLLKEALTEARGLIGDVRNLDEWHALGRGNLSEIEGDKPDIPDNLFDLGV